MATERQREEQINKNAAKSGKEVSSILSSRKKAVNGVVAQATSDPRFATNATVRNRLYAELSAEYKELNLSINDWTINSTNATAKDFWRYAKEDLPRGAVSGTFGQFSSKYVKDIVGKINPSAVDSSVAMNAHIGGMQQNDIRALIAAVSTTIAEGAVEGLTNKEMAARMQSKIVGKVGQFTFVDSAGRRWSADNYFGMLNRTLHATAARDSYIATATNEAGFDLYQIEGGVTGSSVDNSNDPCDAWAGRIISMTGATKGYPTYQDAISAGVFHPNCVHFVRAIMPSEIKAAKKEQAEERVIATELGAD